MRPQKVLGEEVMGRNWQMLFVVAAVSFMVILAIDFTANNDEVTPRADISPAVVDLARRLHHARSGWCAAWADKGKVQECKDASLVEYKEAVEKPLEVEQ